MWITKEETAQVRKNLKTAFPATKFSVTGSGHSLNVFIVKSDIDFSSFFTVGEDEKREIARTLPSPTEERIADEIEYRENKDEIKYSGYNHNEKDFRSKKAVKALKKMLSIMNAKNYDHSDSQYDHFDIGYGSNLYIINPNK